MVTMIIIGIWHGAGTQFLLFGLFHGVYLTVNHAWRIFRKKPAAAGGPQRLSHLNYAASVLLTLLCVVVGQVLFRADSTPDAFRLLASMVGSGGLGAHAIGALHKPMLLLPPLFAAVWLLPNTQQILGRFGSDAGTMPQRNLLGRRFLWRPGVIWALTIAAAFIVCVAFLEDTGRFLYFQF